MIIAGSALASVVAISLAALTVLVARIAVTPPRTAAERVRILSSDPVGRTVTLDRSPDALVPGRYGLWFSGDTGHARLGDVVSSTPVSVTRAVLGIDFGDLATARRGRYGGWFHLSPHDLGFAWESVSVPTGIGPAPAWLVRAPSESGSAAVTAGTGRWVIQVHGRGVTRAEGLRAVPAFRAAGYHSLLISWRNDGNAPASPDRRYGLGGTEWLDVDAAIRFATNNGATDIVLMGWSMGGATVLQTVANSAVAGVVRGIVLESPVVDWVPTLSFQASERRVPPGVSRAALSLLGSPRAHRLTGQDAPIDLKTLDFVLRGDELRVPVLLLHSSDDGFVPEVASAALAAARPDIVTYHRWSVARHAKLWNLDPERFDRQITDWLATLRAGATPS